MSDLFLNILIDKTFSLIANFSYPLTEIRILATVKSNIAMRNFEQRPTGGHPNSLGNTVEIVDEVLADRDLFDELFSCYLCEDEIVRLRSQRRRRICKEKPEYVLPYLDRLLNEVALIDQPSTNGR